MNTSAVIAAEHDTTPGTQATRHVENTGLRKVKTMNWTEQNVRDEKLLGLLDLELLSQDVVAHGDGLAELVGRHNDHLVALTERFTRLTADRKRLVDFSVWAEASLDDVLAERARVVRETWDWLQAMRGELANRVAILKKAQTALRTAEAELAQRRERVMAGLRKSMAKVHAECMAASAYKGETYFEAEMEADESIVAIDAERAAIGTNLEWVADHWRRSVGDQADVRQRQEEVFKRLMN